MSFQIKPASRQGVKMTLILLTRGMSAFVDETDAPSLSQHKWYADRIGKKWYAVRWDGDKKVYMHRQIACAGKLRVDHHNGHGLHNYRSNLRVCTPSQNSANAWKKGSTSVFKGVSWDKSRCKWKAQIKVLYKTRLIGRFNSEEEAARAYDAEAFKVWGEFSKTNF